MNAGDTLTLPDLISAWRADLRAQGRDPEAAERRRVAQAAFGVDLDRDPPALAGGWIPDWVTNTEAFEADRLAVGAISAGLARQWAALPDGTDPFAGLLEAPLVIGMLYEHHAAGGREPDTDSMLLDLVGTLWNLAPTATAVVTTSALYRTGPSARIVTTAPADDEPIACPRCEWAGTIGETEIEFFRDLSHRECPRCGKMLVIVPY